MADENDMELEDLAAAGAGEDAAPPSEPGEEAEGEETPVLQAQGAGASSGRTAADLAAVYNIPVNVSAVLGKSTMQVSSLLKLGRGAVLELDRKVGEAIDIYVNNRLVARGEVVVVEDRLGVTMTEIIKSDNN